MNSMEEDIEHLKDIKEDFKYSVEHRTSITNEEYLNAHRKILAIENILNELEKSKNKLNLIAEVCVDESKLHIENSDAIKEIKKILKG